MEPNQVEFGTSAWISVRKATFLLWMNSPSTVRQWMHQGRIKATHFSVRKTRIHIQDLLEFAKRENRPTARIEAYAAENGIKLQN